MRDSGGGNYLNGGSNNSNKFDSSPGGKNFKIPGNSNLTGAGVTSPGDHLDEIQISGNNLNSNSNTHNTHRKVGFGGVEEREFEGGHRGTTPKNQNRRTTAKKEQSVKFRGSSDGSNSMRGSSEGSINHGGSSVKGSIVNRGDSSEGSMLYYNDSANRRNSVNKTHKKGSRGSRRSKSEDPITTLSIRRENPLNPINLNARNALLHYREEADLKADKVLNRAVKQSLAVESSRSLNDLPPPKNKTGTKSEISNSKSKNKASSSTNSKKKGGAHLFYAGGNSEDSLNHFGLNSMSQSRSSHSQSSLTKTSSSESTSLDLSDQAIHRIANLKGDALKKFLFDARESKQGNFDVDSDGLNMMNNNNNDDGNSDATHDSEELDEIAEIKSSEHDVHHRTTLEGEDEYNAASEDFPSPFTNNFVKDQRLQVARRRLSGTILHADALTEWQIRFKTNRFSQFRLANLSRYKPQSLSVQRAMEALKKCKHMGQLTLQQSIQILSQVDHINDPKILENMRRQAFCDPNAGQALVTQQVPRRVGNVIVTAKRYSTIDNKFDKNFQKVKWLPHERTKHNAGMVNSQSCVRVEEEIKFRGFLFQRSHTMWAKYTSKGELGLFPAYFDDFLGKNRTGGGGKEIHGWRSEERLNRKQLETTNCSNRLRMKPGAYLRGELRSDKLVDPEVLQNLPSQDPLDDNYNDTQTGLDRSHNREGNGPSDAFSTQQSFFSHISRFLELQALDFGPGASVLHSAWKPGNKHSYIHRQFNPDFYIPYCFLHTHKESESLKQMIRAEKGSLKEEKHFLDLTGISHVLDANTGSGFINSVDKSMNREQLEEIAKEQPEDKLERIQRKLLDKAIRDADKEIDEDMKNGNYEIDTVHKEGVDSVTPYPALSSNLLDTVMAIKDAKKHITEIMEIRARDNMVVGIYATVLDRSRNLMLRSFERKEEKDDATFEAWKNRHHFASSEGKHGLYFGRHGTKNVHHDGVKAPNLTDKKHQSTLDLVVEQTAKMKAKNHFSYASHARIKDASDAERVVLKSSAARLYRKSQTNRLHPNFVKTRHPAGMNVRVPSFEEAGIELYRESQLHEKEEADRVRGTKEKTIPKRKFFKEKPTHPCYPPSYACLRAGFFETHNCRYYELVNQVYNQRTGETLLTARRAEPFYNTFDFRSGELNLANSRARVLSLEKPILGQIRMAGVSRVELIKTMRPDSDAKRALDLIHRNIMAVRRKKRRDTNFMSMVEKTKEFLGGTGHTVRHGMEIELADVAGSSCKVASKSDHEKLVLSDFPMASMNYLKRALKQIWPCESQLVVQLQSVSVPISVLRQYEDLGPNSKYKMNYQGFKGNNTGADQEEVDSAGGKFSEDELNEGRHMSVTGGGGRFRLEEDQDSEAERMHVDKLTDRFLSRNNSLNLEGQHRASDRGSNSGSGSDSHHSDAEKNYMMGEEGPGSDGGDSEEFGTHDVSEGIDTLLDSNLLSNLHSDLGGSNTEIQGASNTRSFSGQKQSGFQSGLLTAGSSAQLNSISEAVDEKLPSGSQSGSIRGPTQAGSIRGPTQARGTQQMSVKKSTSAAPIDRDHIIRATKASYLKRHNTNGFTIADDDDPALVGEENNNNADTAASPVEKPKHPLHNDNFPTLHKSLMGRHAKHKKFVEHISESQANLRDNMDDNLMMVLEDLPYLTLQYGDQIKRTKVAKIVQKGPKDVGSNEVVFLLHDEVCFAFNEKDLHKEAERNSASAAGERGSGSSQTKRKFLTIRLHDLDFELPAPGASQEEIDEALRVNEEEAIAVSADLDVRGLFRTQIEKVKTAEKNLISKFGEHQHRHHINPHKKDYMSCFDGRIAMVEKVLLDVFDKNRAEAYSAGLTKQHLFQVAHEQGPNSIHVNCSITHRNFADLARHLLGRQLLDLALNKKSHHHLLHTHIDLENVTPGIREELDGCINHLNYRSGRVTPAADLFYTLGYELANLGKMATEAHPDGESTVDPKTGKKRSITHHSSKHHRSPWLPPWFLDLGYDETSSSLDSDAHGDIKKDVLLSKEALLSHGVSNPSDIDGQMVYDKKVRKWNIGQVRDHNSMNLTNHKYWEGRKRLVRTSKKAQKMDDDSDLWIEQDIDSSEATKSGSSYNASSSSTSSSSEDQSSKTSSSEAQVSSSESEVFGYANSSRIGNSPHKDGKHRVVHLSKSNSNSKGETDTLSGSSLGGSKQYRPMDNLLRMIPGNHSETRFRSGNHARQNLDLSNSGLNSSAGGNKTNLSDSLGASGKLNLGTSLISKLLNQNKSTINDLSQAQVVDVDSQSQSQEAKSESDDESIPVSVLGSKQSEDAQPEGVRAPTTKSRGTNKNLFASLGAEHLREIAKSIVDLENSSGSNRNESDAVNDIVTSLVKSGKFSSWREEDLQDIARSYTQSESQSADFFEADLVSGLISDAMSTEVSKDSVTRFNKSNARSTNKPPRTPTTKSRGTNKNLFASLGAEHLREIAKSIVDLENSSGSNRNESDAVNDIVTSLVKSGKFSSWREEDLQDIARSYTQSESQSADFFEADLVSGLISDAMSTEVSKDSVTRFNKSNTPNKPPRTSQHSSHSGSVGKDPHHLSLNPSTTLDVQATRGSVRKSKKSSRGYGFSIGEDHDASISALHSDPKFQRLEPGAQAKILKEFYKANPAQMDHGKMSLGEGAKLDLDMQDAQSDVRQGSRKAPSNSRSDSRNGTGASNSNNNKNNRQSYLDMIKKPQAPAGHKPHHHHHTPLLKGNEHLGGDAATAGRENLLNSDAGNTSDSNDNHSQSEGSGHSEGEDSGTPPMSENSNMPNFNQASLFFPEKSEKTPNRRRQMLQARGGMTDDPFMESDDYDSQSDKSSNRSSRGSQNVFGYDIYDPATGSNYGDNDHNLHSIREEEGAEDSIDGEMKDHDSDIWSTDLENHMEGRHAASALSSKVTERSVVGSKISGTSSNCNDSFFELDQEEEIPEDSYFSTLEYDSFRFFEGEHEAAYDISDSTNGPRYTKSASSDSYNQRQPGPTVGFRNYFPDSNTDSDSDSETDSEDDSTDSDSDEPPGQAPAPIDPNQKLLAELGVIPHHTASIRPPIRPRVLAPKFSSRKGKLKQGSSSKRKGILKKGSNQNPAMLFYPQNNSVSNSEDQFHPHYDSSGTNYINHALDNCPDRADHNIFRHPPGNPKYYSFSPSAADARKFHRLRLAATISRGYAPAKRPSTGKWY